MSDPNKEREVRTLHIGRSDEDETQLTSQDGWEVGIINHFSHREIAEKICRRYNEFEQLVEALEDYLRHPSTDGKQPERRLKRARLRELLQELKGTP